MGNVIQLHLHYAIGGYISANSGQGRWGIGAIAATSEQLKKELPSLRGYPASSLKSMRSFYEAWAPLDNDAPNSPDATDELGATTNRISFEEFGDKLHPGVFVASANEPEPANASVKDRLLSLLRTDPRISYERAAKRLGVSRSSIRRYLCALEADGSIQRVGADTNGHGKMLRG